MDSLSEILDNIQCDLLLKIACIYLLSKQVQLYSRANGMGVKMSEDGEREWV